MLFKSLSFACFTTSWLVSSGPLPNNNNERLLPRSHDIERLPVHFPKRQEPIRNETRSSVPASIAPEVHTVASLPISTLDQGHLKSTSLKDSVSSVVPVPTWSSSYSSQALPSGSDQSSKIIDVILSKSTAIITSQRNVPSTSTRFIPPQETSQPPVTLILSTVLEPSHNVATPSESHSKLEETSGAPIENSSILPAISVPAISTSQTVTSVGGSSTSLADSTLVLPQASTSIAEVTPKESQLPIVSSGHQDSTFIGVTGTWLPLSSSAVLSLSSVQPPMATGISTQLPSSIISIPTPISSLYTSLIATSESRNDNTRDTPVSVTSLPPNSTPSNSTEHPTLSTFASTGIINTASVITPSSISASEHTSGKEGSFSSVLPISASQQTLGASLARVSSVSAVGNQYPNITSTFSSPSSISRFGDAALSTSLSVISDKTRSAASEISAAPAWGNSTARWPTSTTSLARIMFSSEVTNSASSTVGPVASATSALSTFKTFKVTGGISFNFTINFAPTGSTSQSAVTSPPSSTAVASPPPPPPLNRVQTAGVVIASTTGILIAIVAAFYIARRYHAKKSRRASTGSIYPKSAYLYDPPTGGNESGIADVFMSGGASGMPVDKRNSRASRNSPSNGHRYSTGTAPAHFPNTNYPFGSAEDAVPRSKHSTNNSISSPTNAAAAISAAIKGYKAASQESPTLTEFSDVDIESSSDMCPSPAFNPVIYNTVPVPASRTSILSEITSMACNPNSKSDVTTLPSQSGAPHSIHSNRRLSRIKGVVFTDPFKDSFEHDLLLEVDTRTETPDSVTVFAPPKATNRLSRSPAVRVSSKDPWVTSTLSPNGASRPRSRHAESFPVSPDATIVASECFSPVDYQYLMPQNQADDTVSPLTPPQGTLNRGWDDIKRYSADKVVPSPTGLSPPLHYMSTFPVKQKSLPQLRRDSGDAMISRSRSPLAVKTPFKSHKSPYGQVPKQSSTGKLDVIKVYNDDGIRSPDSGFSHSVQSLASLLHRKKSGDMEFACAGAQREVPESEKFPRL